MGGGDYNKGNLSAFDGDLSYVEVHMRQMFQEQDENRRKGERGQGQTKKTRKFFGPAHGTILDTEE